MPFVRRKRSQVVLAARPDIVQFEDPETALLHVPTLRSRSPHLPIVAALHDDGPALRLSLGLPRSEIERTTFVYCAVGALADLCIAMTESNARAFIDDIGISSRKVALVPSGVDVPDYRRPSSVGNSVVFIGNLFYRPNAEAVDSLINHILPRIRSSVPDATAIVVGMGQERWSGAHPHVVFHGFVTDLDSVLRSAAVGVAPLSSGSGMKVKMLSYAAAGLPIVATSVAADGFGGLPGVLLAEHPDNFADCVVLLLTNPPMARRLGQGNRRYVARHFTWRRSARALRRHYERCCAVSLARGSYLGRHALDLPGPLWLKEGRVAHNTTPDYYVIASGRVLIGPR